MRNRPSCCGQKPPRKYFPPPCRQPRGSSGDCPHPPFPILLFPPLLPGGGRQCLPDRECGYWENGRACSFASAFSRQCGGGGPTARRLFLALDLPRPPPPPPRFHMRARQLARALF